MTAIESLKDTLSQPDVIREAWGLAGRICNTEFVPKSLRGSTEKVMAALLTGRELGLGPMTTLAHVHVIEGRPALSAKAKQALAVAAGHDIDIVETNSERCTVVARRAGSERDVTVTWTMKDAQVAGLSTKDNWKKHPRRMLQARAISEAVDLVASDATLGIPLTVEEAQDLDVEAPKVAQVVRRKTSTTPAREIEPAPTPALHVARNGTATATIEAPVEVTDDGEIVTDEPAEEVQYVPGITTNQRKHIFALQRAAKITTEALKAIISEVTSGRTDSLSNAGGLTDFEADEVIARLDRLEVEQRAEVTEDEEPF